MYLYLYYLNPAQWGLTACVVHMVITPQFASNRKQFRDQPRKFLEQGGKFLERKGQIDERKKAQILRKFTSLLLHYNHCTNHSTYPYRTLCVLELELVFCSEKLFLFLDCELSYPLPLPPSRSLLPNTKSKHRDFWP